VSYTVDDATDKLLTEFLDFMRNHGDHQGFKWKDGRLFNGPLRLDLKALAASLTDPRGKWDPEHDQDAPCHSCSHTYERHFDTYEDMEPVGCKYCQCEKFVEPPTPKVFDGPPIVSGPAPVAPVSSGPRPKGKAAPARSRRTPARAGRAKGSR
jgi:hypothetical protein